MEAEIRRARRRFQGVMVAALGLAVLPSVAVLLYSGEWIGLGRQLLFLGLAAALVFSGAAWARWGLALWFAITGLIFFLAGFVAAALSTRPSIGDAAPHVLLGALHIVFAAVFALSFGIRGWLEHRRPRAR